MTDALLGMLAVVAVALAPTVADVYPIEIKPEHEAVAWQAWMDAGERSCTVRAWIARVGEPPIVNLFAVALDETNVPTEEGETPLTGLKPGRYALHVETAGDCWFNASLVER